jgi:Methyltransferase domain
LLQKNSDIIVDRLKPADVLLDIGGWAHPFNRANYVMDCEPYETRGFYNRTFARNNPIPPIGGTTEYFNQERWIQRDICDKTPFPFRDKELDFVTCSHTLEDIRDPLWVCAEMVRIAKAGYIEIPSRMWESCRGHEPGIAGLSHHRWLIDIEGNSIRFLQKYHRIHNWRYSLPKSVLKRLREEETVQWLFWQGSFTYSETVLHGNAHLDELEKFVRGVHTYPRALLFADSMRSGTALIFNRVIHKAGRILRTA